MKKVFILLIVMVCSLCRGLALETTTFTTDEGAVLNISLSSVGNTATVTGMEDISNFQGVLNIPLEIAYNGSSYSVVTIADEAFQGGRMTEVSLGNVTTVGVSAFRNCSSIQSLDLSCVKIIGDYAFRMKGSALKTLIFSSNLQSVGKQPFSSSVTQVTVNVEDLMQINGLPIPTFDNADVKYFVNGELLTDIIIPEGVSSISGFNQIKGISTISFPSTTTTISGFSNTTAATVYCHAVTPPELTGLSSCYNIPLYVPYKKEMAYKMAAGWKNFTNIIEMEGEEIPALSDTITLTEAGTLSEALSMIDKSEITNLAIRGKINAADIKILRNAADKLATLDTLDISMVELVPSNEAYYIYTTMSDGSMNAEYHRFFISTERRDTFFIQALLSSWPPHYYDHYDHNMTAAFTGTRFKRIIMPKNISDIGERTFMGCGNLQEVVMSEAPTSIGAEAFRDCKTLMLIPELNKAESIGERAFYNCAQLGLLTQAKHLDLSSVVEIDISAFENCKYIASVKCSDHLRSIGGGAFSGCTSLVSFNLPANLARLSYDSFENTPWLKASKEVVDGITYIGTVAIEVDKNMSIFSPREGTLGIADRFYHSGDNIKTIQLPSSLQYIGKLSLRDINLSSIQLPEALECIGERAFEGWISLKEISFPSSLKEIGRMAFNGSGLESIVIPDGVEEIGYRAFYQNSSLKKVYYGAQHATGTYIFNYCPNLEEVIVGSKVKAIPAYAFSLCESINKLELGNQLEIIGDFAFEDSKALTHTDFPSNLRVIGVRAFEDCPLENIVIGENIEELGSDCLASTISLEYNRATMPEGFFKSRKLKSIIIGSNLKIIPEKAFDGCGYLNSVSMGSGVETIEKDAFAECKALSEISVSPILKEIGDGAFHNCVSLKQFEFPSTLTSIGNNAFYQNGIERLLLPAVMTIGESAFAYCKAVKEIELPTTLQSIGKRAFDYCELITIVKSHIKSPFEIPNDAFYFSKDFIENCTLMVPTGTSDAYKTTYAWARFKNIVEYDDASAMNTLQSEESRTPTFYNIAGNKSQGQRGLNIVRYSDGTVKKVLLK